MLGVTGVALLVGAFFLGRWSRGAFGGSVDAGARGERPSLESALQEGKVEPSAPETPSAANAEKSSLLARPKSLSAADAALLDSRNKYTVQAAQYNDTELGRASARRVFDYFVRQNVPVCTPYQRGDDIFVFVGAAPNTVDLEVVQRALKALGGPDATPGAFKDAFIARIDSIVQRNP